jgi:hypothetical protein
MSDRILELLQSILEHLDRAGDKRLVGGGHPCPMSSATSTLRP